MADAKMSDSPFFVRRAPQKVLNVRIQKNLRTEAGTDGQHSKWGINYFPQMIKKLAKRCGFTDADNYTMRSNRRAGITKLAGSGLGSANVMAAARHKSIDANFLYQQENEGDHIARSKVFHASMATNRRSSISTHSMTSLPIGNETHHQPSQFVQQAPQFVQQQFQPQQNFNMPQPPFQQSNPMMMGMMSGMMQGMMMSMCMSNPMMMGMGMMNNMFQQQQQQQHTPIIAPQQQKHVQQDSIQQIQRQVMAPIAIQQQITPPVQVTPKPSNYRCQLLNNGYNDFDNGQDPPEESDDDDASVDNMPSLPQFTQTQSFNQQASNFSTQPTNGASL